MQAAASPAWEFGNPCRQRRHPHGNLEIHAGGGVTRMEKIESSGHKPADCTSERRNMPISKQIRVRRGYTKLSHHDFWLVLRRLYEGLLKNPHFPKPPVDLGLFKTKIDKYSAAITATMGGAKIAFSQRDSLREDLTKMPLELAGYVEAESYNDPAIFATSELEALPSAHVPHQPLDRPRIPKIDHGAVSGELLVWMPPSLAKSSSTTCGTPRLTPTAFLPVSGRRRLSPVPSVPSRSRISSPVRCMPFRSALSENSGRPIGAIP